MRRAIVEGAAQEADREINLTPMLDVVFIMLIFFVVVASFVKEAGIDLNATDSSNDIITLDENILIEIGENDEIWMGTRLIDPRAVRANIERLGSEKPDAIVIIRADKRSSNNALVQVMDASRAAGMYKISLVAEKKGTIST